jgi:hypothetical protein
MGNTIISIYKYSTNNLGYNKQYIDPSEIGEYSKKGWHRTQEAAISDKPVRLAPKPRGRAKKA